MATEDKPHGVDDGMEASTKATHKPSSPPKRGRATQSIAEALGVDPDVLLAILKAREKRDGKEVG